MGINTEHILVFAVIKRDQRRLNLAFVMALGIYISFAIAPIAAMPLIAVLDQLNASG